MDISSMFNGGGLRERWFGCEEMGMNVRYVLFPTSPLHSSEFFFCHAVAGGEITCLERFSQLSVYIHFSSTNPV